jgi:hypothetical protein
MNNIETYIVPSEAPTKKVDIVRMGEAKDCKILMISDGTFDSFWNIDKDCLNRFEMSDSEHVIEPNRYAQEFHRRVFELHRDIETGYHPDIEVPVLI